MGSCYSASSHSLPPSTHHASELEPTTLLETWLSVSPVCPPPVLVQALAVLPAACRHGKHARLWEEDVEARAGEEGLGGRSDEGAGGREGGGEGAVGEAGDRRCDARGGGSSCHAEGSEEPQRLIDSGDQGQEGARGAAGDTPLCTQPAHPPPSALCTCSVPQHSAPAALHATRTPSAPRPHPRQLAELRADPNPNPNPNPNPDQLAELRDFELSSFDIKRVRRPYSYGVTAGLGSGLAWTSRGCAAAVASPSCGGRRTSSLQRHRNLARYWYFT